MDDNVEQRVCYKQPKTTAQRLAIANDFRARFGYPIPMLVDPIENPANAVYAGWPERFYILDESRRIVYKGEPGPFGFHPEEVEAWLDERFGEARAAGASSDRQRAAG